MSGRRLPLCELQGRGGEEGRERVDLLCLFSLVSPGHLGDQSSFYMSGVVPLRFFTRQHGQVMWPFVLGSSYILLKLVEMADPANLSEQDKRDSRACFIRPAGGQVGWEGRACSAPSPPPFTGPALAPRPSFLSVFIIRTIFINIYSQFLISPSCWAPPSGFSLPLPSCPLLPSPSLLLLPLLSFQYMNSSSLIYTLFQSKY